MEHANLEVIRRWFDAFERSDMEGARALMASDAVLNVSRPLQLKGEYAGFDAILDFFSRKRAAAGDGFGYRLEALFTNADSVAALLTLFARRNGAPQEWRQVAIYRIRNKRIVGIEIIEEDPH